MRHQGDPLADEAAASLFDAIKGHSPEEVAKYIVAFVSQDFSKSWNLKQLIPEPPELVAYFESFDEFKLTSKEIEYLEKGSDFFNKHGPWIVFALGVRSLLKQYAHTKAIEVLRLTTLLVKHVNRRIMETMQFVLDVMTEGWTEGNSHGTGKLNLHHPGLMSIKKLRLLHAMIRYRLHHQLYDTSLGGFDDALLGSPINQEDMVFAVHTFSIEIIEGLREMRISVTDEDAENYFQCWKIIGRGLGVRKELEPENYKDALALQELIYERHFTLPNATGPVLASALMNWFNTTIPLMDNKLLVTFIKEFNGPENFSILEKNLNINLGTAHEDLRQHLTDDLHFHEETARTGLAASDNGQMAIDNFFLSFLKTLLTIERGGKNQTFRIGDGFLASWNLNKIDDKSPPKEEVFWLAVKTFLTNLIKKIKNLFGSVDKRS